ncbi:MAG: sensor histidine kinase [Rikenellaceae bacterium]|nr:sensor histidine kinase [Rikenellaceae bacterium]
MAYHRRKAALHLLAWAAAFFINIILIQSYSVRIEWTNTLVCWALYIFIFYANYLFLIPRLLKRRWYISVYVILVFSLLAISYAVVKKTAIRSARERTLYLSERLLEYGEVKASFDEKERVREEKRRIENDRSGQLPQNPEQRQRQGREGEPPRGGVYRPGRAGTMLDSLMSLMPDSLIRAHFESQKDSIMALDTSLTPAEEVYGQLRREYDQARWYARMLSRNDNNPFSQHNLQFLFALIFFYMASIVVFFAEQTGKSEKRRREIEKEKTSAELAYLKQQINPHFLFNTLNSIYSYTIGVSEEASDAVLKLSSILRYMLYETNRDRVPLGDELAVLDNYIDLQRLRTTSKTEIEVTVRGDTHRRRIEPMLLIPILENAFKYGVDSVEPSFVRIGIEVKSNDFTLQVTNKVVRRNEGDQSHSGIGLNNIRRRLELIYGAGNYELKAGEKNGIFSVILRLNLKE